MQGWYQWCVLEWSSDDEYLLGILRKDIFLFLYAYYYLVLKVAA